MRQEQYQGSRILHVCDAEGCGFRTPDHLLALQHERRNDHKAADTEPATDKELSDAAADEGTDPELHAED